MPVITPAPSPSRASQPTAPRCVMLTTTSLTATRRISWLASPLMLQTKPTPHASFSKLGSYNPWAFGKALPQPAIKLKTKTLYFFLGNRSGVCRFDHLSIKRKSMG
eukprot:Pompholyxophrys_punicea_v1_NODE_14_length_6313_cov_26.358102.p4 type:complete len:106 gc:universal NODE_14_length_6313_cov_26.358102:1659-1342(-)